MRLCEVLDVPFEAFRPKKVYYRGWGHKCIKAIPIVCIWTLHVQDLQNQATELTFDLVDDDFPLTIGMDIRRYCVTDLRAKPPRIYLKRPTDTKERVFEVYLTTRTDLDVRARLSIIPTASALMTTGCSGMKPRTLAKRLHRLTHAHPDELIALCRRAGKSSPEIEEEVRKLSENCIVCSNSGFPAPSKKISISHVNKALNVEIQIDFTFCEIRGSQYTVLHIVDTGTGYSEGAITNDRNAGTIVYTVEMEWLHRHGRPERLSADDELNSKAVRRFASSQGIAYKPRPVRRHNKTGILERKNV